MVLVDTGWEHRHYSIGSVGVERWRRDLAVNKNIGENRHPHHFSVLEASLRINFCLKEPQCVLEPTGSVLFWVKPAYLDGNGVTGSSRACYVQSVYASSSLYEIDFKDPFHSIRAAARQSET